MAESLRATQRAVESSIVGLLTESVILVDLHFHPQAESHAHAGAGARRMVPRYNRARRELWFLDLLVKRLRHDADNQQRLCAVFEEEAWAMQIDDPLVPNG